jgi:hypothetical protein
MMKIGFTGTQDGMTDPQKSTLRDLLETVGEPIERQVQAWFKLVMWTPATRGRMAEIEKKTKRHSRKLDRARVLTPMYVAR